MATVGNLALTLADWAKRLDPMGKPAKIIEMLGQTNEVLDDMLIREGNLITGHRTTIRTGLPKVYWKIINQGVRTSKSTTAQIDSACGKLEAWSRVDREVAEIGGNPAAVRLSEAQAYIEALNQKMASTLFYGNETVSPEEFTGLAVRYSTLTKTAAVADNVISAGGSGSDNTSIWLVVWSDLTICGHFPKGSKAGLMHEDWGLKPQIIQDAVKDGDNVKVQEVYLDKWCWSLGLTVKDWRFAVRICNIDASELAAGNTKLIPLIIRALHRVPSLKMGKAALYMNRACVQALDIERFNTVAGAGMRYDEVDGQLRYSFRGVPIRVVDALHNAEAAVT